VLSCEDEDEEAIQNVLDSPQMTDAIETSSIDISRENILEIQSAIIYNDQYLIQA
jgi:hypothetical protein